MTTHGLGGPRISAGLLLCCAALVAGCDVTLPIEIATPSADAPTAPASSTPAATTLATPNHTAFYRKEH